LSLAMLTKSRDALDKTYQSAVDQCNPNREEPDTPILLAEMAVACVDSACEGVKMVPDTFPFMRPLAGLAVVRATFSQQPCGMYLYLMGLFDKFVLNEGCRRLRDCSNEIEDSFDKILDCLEEGKDKIKKEGHMVISEIKESAQNLEKVLKALRDLLNKLENAVKNLKDVPLMEEILEEANKHIKELLENMTLAKSDLEQLDGGLISGATDTFIEKLEKAIKQLAPKHLVDQLDIHLKTTMYTKLRDMIRDSTEDESARNGSYTQLTMRDKKSRVAPKEESAGTGAPTTKPRVCYRSCS